MTIQELYDLAKESNWLDKEICINDECGDKNYATCIYITSYNSHEVIMID